MRVHSCPDSLRDLVFGPQHQFLFWGHKWRARHYIDRPWWRLPPHRDRAPRASQRTWVQELLCYPPANAPGLHFGFDPGVPLGRPGHLAVFGRHAKKTEAIEKIKDAMGRLGHDLDYIIIDDVVGEP